MIIIFRITTSPNINVRAHTPVAPGLPHLLRAALPRHHLQSRTACQVDRLLAPPDRGLVDYHSIPRTLRRMRNSDDRQGSPRRCFDDFLKPITRTCLVTQVKTITTQIESVVSLVEAQKKNAEEQISKVAKQYGLIE